MTFSKAERLKIAAMTQDELVSFCRMSPQGDIGKNMRLLLHELGIRLGIPADAVSLTFLRTKKVGKPDETVALFNWGMYSAQRNEAMRQIKGRRWNQTTKCNYFVLSPGEVAGCLTSLSLLYNRMVFVDEKSYDIRAGSAPAEWAEPLAYNLLGSPVDVNLGAAFNHYSQWRINDEPIHMAIHGEIDGDYRSLFGRGLPAKPSVLDAITFQTRHQLLAFRFGVSHGKPRYMTYLTQSGAPGDFMFAGGKELDRTLAQVKSTQQRLGHPIIEHSSFLIEQLKPFET